MAVGEQGGLRRNRDFVRLWIGQSISQLGSQITLLALPLVAIRTLRAGPFEVGLLAAAETLPFLLIGLPAGVWVDRWRRRPILVATDIARAGILATVPLAYAADALTMAHLYAVALLVGGCTVFFDVAYQAYLPAVVDREQLLEGNARLTLSYSGAQVVGPGIAGVLVQLVKAPLAIAADSLSFVCSALFIGAIRTDEATPALDDDSRPTMRRGIAEGLGYVFRHPLLSRIAVCTGLFNLFSAIGMAVFLLYAVRDLDIDPAVVGLIFSLGSIGFVLGSMAARRVARRLGVGPALVVSAAVSGISFVLVPLAPADAAVPFFVVALALETGAIPVYNVTQVSLRQTITPARLQGRMTATMRFVVWGTMPLGSFVGGALGHAVGLRTTLWVSAVGLAGSVSPLLAGSILRLREMPTQQAD